MPVLSRWTKIPFYLPAPTPTIHCCVYKAFMCALIFYVLLLVSEGYLYPRLPLFLFWNSSRVHMSEYVKSSPLGGVLTALFWTPWWSAIMIEAILLRMAPTRALRSVDPCSTVTLLAPVCSGWTGHACSALSPIPLHTAARTNRSFSSLFFPLLLAGFFCIVLAVCCVTQSVDQAGLELPEINLPLLGLKAYATITTTTGWSGILK